MHWLSVTTIHRNLNKRKSYLYETDESVQNGHRPFDLAIRMVSNSYSVKWNFAISILDRTVGREYSNKRNLFSRIVPFTWCDNIIQSFKSWAKWEIHQSYERNHEILWFQQYYYTIDWRYPEHNLWLLDGDDEHHRQLLRFSTNSNILDLSETQWCPKQWIKDVASLLMIQFW